MLTSAAAASLPPASPCPRSALERLSFAPGRSPKAGGGGGASLDLAASYREAGIAPIHEGYEATLDALVPLLLEEAQQCIALHYPEATPQQQQRPPRGRAVRFAGAPAAAAVEVGGAEVQGVLSSLLSGLAGELSGLVDAVKPHRALLCLPMLGATLAWKQRLAAHGAAARPVAALLAQSEQRLAAMLSAYFSERASAIQRCVR